ncbi:hypothetical protein [Providencia sp. PROV117]|uniref:hypothetical protein n=1 Tax=Providencia sp. PROV117 TaxID=2949828 RepID=UPI00234BD4EE|nr:hypothetical protein [Providencia sp. PROV117]
MDAGATPSVSAVKLTGELAVGSTLHGTYTFDANGGDTTDISTYAWGNKGQTAQEVSNGASVEVSGQVPGHTLTSSDVGLVKEMSVQAKNHLQVTGNTVTIATDASANEGNETQGGDSDGKIIDSAGQPLIAGLHLQGQLAVGQSLSGVYTFNANGGNPTDASTYAWGDKGQTGQAVGSGQTIATSGQVPEYTLTAADIGKIKEVSVQAKNGLAVIGNTETLATDAGAGEGNDTTGGNEGQIIDPAAQPVLSQLVLHGTLAVHNELVGRYTFDANGGDATDHSTYVWGDKGTTNAQVANGETITESGDVPAYTLTAADVGKVKEVSVQAKNGLAITGNTLTVATDATSTDGNETDGGDGHGGIVDAGAPPSINAVTLSGELAMGSTLTSTYTWVANGGEPNEKTEVLWGPKGETADDVLVHGVPVTTLGQTTHTLTAPDVGRVLEVALLPKNGFGVEGDVVTLATDAPASEGNATTGGDEGHIINPTAIPSVMQLSISGDLALFGNLSGTYQFNANGGSTEDVSLYLWGEKGTTANDVLNAGQPVLASGVVGHYALLSTDAGKVLELSVLPKNGNAITGDAKTVATDASASEGNNTTGGDDGHIINPAAIPSVEGLHLLGSLAVGSDLTATYTFNANTGNAVDNSQYLWGDKGQTAGEVMASGQAVVTSGQVQAYTLTTEDVGKVKEVSVLAKNGLDVTGNTQTLATDASESDGNDTTGGNGEGGIIDPTASPSVSELKLAGILTTGQSLSATYTFAGNGGDATDHSTYVWGTKGNTAGNVANGQTITTSGQVPDITLTAADVGTIKEVSVQAKNGLNVTGNTATLATDATPAEGNDTTGGNGGEIAAPAFKEIAVNGFNFAANSGFPTTGFVNATYTLVLDNANASDYNWTSSASWVSVDSTGKVTFTGEPSGQEAVTITASPKTGEGESFSHRFTLKQWFMRNETYRTWSASKTYCESQGMQLPTRAQLTNSTVIYPSNNATRAVDTLWSEWGDIRSYGFANYNSWTSEAASSGRHYNVSLHTGIVHSDTDSTSSFVTCLRGL